jgi:hypothetical protein
MAVAILPKGLQLVYRRADSFGEDLETEVFGKSLAWQNAQVVIVPAHDTDDPGSNPARVPRSRKLYLHNSNVIDHDIKP